LSTTSPTPTRYSDSGRPVTCIIDDFVVRARLPVFIGMVLCVGGAVDVFFLIDDTLEQLEALFSFALFLHIH
jgi:hypothetical protein